MKLREFAPADLPPIYEICLRTGNAGADASATCSHPELLGDYYAAPYCAHDPALCLVLADEAGPCGYILGAADTRAFVAWFNASWLPAIRAKYRGLRPRSGASDAWLLEALRRDARVPRCVEEFPAHLHIDLLPRAQGLGWGRRMFEAWTRRAAERGARGVHLGVSPRNTGAIAFYERMGMTRLKAGPGAVMFGLQLGATGRG